jgi:hypothetical protein
MSDFIRFHLSSNAIQTLLKQPGGRGKKAVTKITFTDQEIEASLLPLFDYFDQVVSAADDTVIQV